MDLTNSGMIKIAASLCSGAFLAYCVYFDHKRRSDPLFKQKLRERRLKARKQVEDSEKTQFPDMRDYDAMQTFFLKELQAGDDCMALGEMEKAVEHICNALVVCAQPQQMLQVLQQTMPPQAFEMLIKRLPSVSQLTKQAMSTNRSTILVEDDVE